MLDGGRTLSRRRLLQTAAGGAAALALPAWGRGGGFARPLPLPSELTGSRLSIPMQPAEVKILPGAPTKMWTFGGSFPGPLVRRPTGVPTIVDFTHRLPASAGELSVHLHGSHTPSKDDGQPGGLTARQPRSFFCDVAPGLPRACPATTCSSAPAIAGATATPSPSPAPPSAGPRSGTTTTASTSPRRNNWRGLQGMWITEDAVDAAVPLPRGEREIPLVIGDRAFDHKNQLTDPFGTSPGRPTTGPPAASSSSTAPTGRTARSRRPATACGSSTRRASAPTTSTWATAPFTQVGADGGLMPRAVNRRHVLIGPGERVDVVVDFRRAAHRDVLLRSVRRADGPTGSARPPTSGR